MLPAGRIVGRKSGRLLRYTGDGHLVTLAPTRSGKGVSAVIPNLLDHPGSVVVTDIKGENYAVTAMRRARDLGHEVRALDPFDVAGGRDGYNPLDILDPDSPHAPDDATLIADMLVAPGEGGRSTGDRFWDDEARALLAGVVMYVAQLPDPNKRSLPHVRELLTGTPQELDQLWAAMLAAGGPQGLFVRRTAARVLQKADRERSGVISSAQRHTHFLDSSAMTLTLARSSVDLTALTRGRLSLYLILPPDYLDTHHRWLRLMVACTLRAVTRASVRPAERVLFVLDEFAHLGPMAPLVRAVSLLTGYGLSLWLFVQDLAKLRAVYPDAWGTFLANADVLQVFGTNDVFTAEYLSKMTGQSTVAVQSANWSGGRNSRDLHILGGSQSSAGGTVGQTGRPLLFADEVRRLPLSQQLVFVKGASPLRTERVSYLEDPEFVGLYARNPLYATAPLGGPSAVGAPPAWRGALRSVAARIGIAS
jgi:type IV secretion system protein VirD4